MIAADDSVSEAMRLDPHAIRVFLDFRFACVGCPIASMHTVADAAHEYGADLKAFLTALNAAPADGAILSRRDAAQPEPFDPDLS